MFRILVWILSQLTSVLIMFSVTCGIGVSFSPSNAMEQYQIEDLKELIKNGNYLMFHNNLVEIKRDVYEGKSDKLSFAKFLIEFWEGKQFDLDKFALDDEAKIMYRNSVAATMALGKRDGWLEYDMSEVYEFLKKNTRSLDEWTAVLSIYHLAIAGREQDINLYVELGKSKNYRIFYAAIKGLGIMCNPKARDGLREILGNLNERDRKEIVENEIIKSYESGYNIERCN